jgi:hypothetical protein
VAVPPLPLTGGCGCGAVRFEIDQPLVAALYCHCTRCQRRSGAAAGAAARVEPGSVRIVEGEQRLSSWTPADGSEKVFCATCGSGLMVREPTTHEVIAVRLGTVDGDPGIRPNAHQFVAYAAPWEPIPDDGLPRFDERIPG